MSARQHEDAALAAPRSRFAKGRLHAGLLLLALTLCAARPYASAEPLRVLFIGNSLTAWNDLPGMFAALAAAAGHERPVTRTIAVGEFSLEDHWQEGTAQLAIRQGNCNLPTLGLSPFAAHQLQNAVR